MKQSIQQPRYALLSVFHKEGIVDLAQQLQQLGYTIISTGGTAKALTEKGISVIPVQDITGNPEALDGRMKTISFQIEGGILVDRNKPTHRQQAAELHLPDIQIVVCNLYPFAETIAKPNTTIDEAVEQIDVGGPTMVRSAAKNFHHVLVLVNPKDYQLVPKALQEHTITNSLRQELAAKAFAHLSAYDAQIARYLTKEAFPEELTLPLTKSTQLRYGDNPDQEAALYISTGIDTPIAHLTKKSGRELSATNITDIDAGMKAVSLFQTPAAVVIKHNSPCGIALGDTDVQALTRAIDSDPESAFGGVVVMNKPFTLKAAKVIAAFKASGRGNMDIIAAPDIADTALSLLQEVRKSTGVYTFSSIPKTKYLKKDVRFIQGGAVVQIINDPEANFSQWEVVTKKKPTAKQLIQMKIGWKFASRIRSNTILIMDKTLPMVRGIGSGQTSRVLSAKIAIERAGKYTKRGILVSDSFFPFDDCVKFAAKAGISAIVQQGGSINDAASIAAANKAGISMVCTHQRVFWH